MDINFLRMNFILNIIRRFIALCLIIITLPLQLLIALIIFIELRESPLYFQKRALTLEKKIFTLIKFKTISSKEANKIFHNKIDNIFYIFDQNINIKKFTGFLRLTGLDELPQLYNVLFNHLNFIGPRPLMLEELELIKQSYPSLYELRNNVNSKPGITGLWQVIGERKKGIENLVGLDSFYEKNKSILLDLKILVYTFILLFTASNSDTILPCVQFISKIFSNSITEFEVAEYDKNNHKTIFPIQLPNKW